MSLVLLKKVLLCHFEALSLHGLQKRGEGPRRAPAAAHRHAVLLAKQLHADLVHVGGDVPLGLVQVLCVSLHQGLGDPAASMLRGEQKCGVRVVAGTATEGRLGHLATPGKQHRKCSLEGNAFSLQPTCLRGNAVTPLSFR